MPLSLPSVSVRGNGLPVAYEGCLSPSTSYEQRLSDVRYSPCLTVGQAVLSSAPAVLPQVTVEVRLRDRPEVAASKENQARGYSGCVSSVGTRFVTGQTRSLRNRLHIIAIAAVTVGPAANQLEEKENSLAFRSSVSNLRATIRAGAPSRSPTPRLHDPQGHPAFQQRGHIGGPRRVDGGISGAFPLRSSCGERDG